MFALQKVKSVNEPWACRVLTLNVTEILGLDRVRAVPHDLCIAFSMTGEAESSSRASGPMLIHFRLEQY